MGRLNEPLIFALPTYAKLAAELAERLGAQIGAIERRTFPDGERYHRLITSVSERDVILLGGTVDDQHTLDLFDLGCAIAKYGARRLDLVIPYFGYATMERMTQDREVITAKTRARLLSAIPEAAMGNRAWFVDLHSEGIPHYCEGHLTARHIYAKPALLPVMQELGGGSDMVLASTDAGRAKWVQSLANEIGCDSAIIIKRRLSGAETAVAGVSCDVAGRSVVIYDDMIRTGGSLLGAVDTYRQAGAAAISVITTHGVFPGDAFARLHGEHGLHIAATESHPKAMALAADGLQLIPLAQVLAERIADGGP